MTESGTEKKIKLDYSVIRLALCGFVGLITGCIIFFYPKLLNQKNTVFHEVAYPSKEILDKKITKTIDTLGKLVLSLKVEKLKADCEKTNGPKNKCATDSLNQVTSKLDGQISRYTADINALITFKGHLFRANAEEIAHARTNRTLRFNIDTAKLEKWNDTFSISPDVEHFTATYTIADSSLSEIPTSDETILFKVVKAQSVMAFFDQYPSAGLWILLVLVFCSYCFIVGATAYYLYNKIMDLLKGEGLSKWEYPFMVMCSIILLGALQIITKAAYNDVNQIKPLYFMQNINVSMNWLRGIGYLAGAACLAGFIHTISILGYLAKTVRDDREKLKKLPDTTTEDAKKIQESIDKNTENHKNIVGYFKTYFVLAAIILSLLVLCTGALYSTLNSLSFVKLLTDDWGYSPVRVDFVYFYGAWHTVILLLVYIPAKMRLQEISITTSEEQKAGDPWYHLLKAPFGSFKEILVAGAPLLVGVAQSLFDVLFS